MDVRSGDLQPLGRHPRSVRNRASGLARNDLRPFGRRDRNLMIKVFLSGHGTSRAAGSGEVKTCRGGDVEAGAEAILNELSPK